MKIKQTYTVNRFPKEVYFNNQHGINIEDALDLAGLGRYNYVLLLTCCIIHLGAIVDMLAFSIIVPSASCDLQLELKEKGILTSISFAGFIFALPWGYFADIRGRRKALIISATVGFVFAALSSFATTFRVMIVLKWLGSSFSTASVTLTITYLGECTPKKFRSKFIFIQNCSSYAAELLLFGLAYIFLPMNFNVTLPWHFSYRPWRLIALIFATPLGLGALMIVFLHESPQFLVDKGETEKALHALRSIYAVNGGNKDFYPVMKLISLKPEEGQKSLWDSTLRQMLQIFKPPLLWRTLQLFFIYIICCTTHNVFLMWFPTLFNSLYSTTSEVNNNISFCQKIINNITINIGNEEDMCIDTTPMNTIYSGILSGLLFLSLNVAMIRLASRRKILLIVTFIVSGISALLVNLVQGDIASVVLYAMIQITGICIGNANSYFVDFYPTSYRGLATSLGIMVTSLVCLGGVNLVAALITDYCNITMYAWGTFVLSGAIAAFFLPSDEKMNGLL